MYVCMYVCIYVCAESLNTLEKWATTLFSEIKNKSIGEPSFKGVPYRKEDLKVCVVMAHTHTLTHSYSHTLIHSYTHTLIHSYIHTLTHSYTPTLIHSYFHTFIHLYTHTHILTPYTHMLIYTHIIYTHILIHSYTHTLIHSYSQYFGSFPLATYGNSPLLGLFHVTIYL